VQPLDHSLIPTSNIGRRSGRRLRPGPQALDPHVGHSPHRLSQVEIEGGVVDSWKILFDSDKPPAASLLGDAERARRSVKYRLFLQLDQ
jgi:hypothetical protein